MEGKLRSCFHVIKTNSNGHIRQGGVNYVGYLGGSIDKMKLMRNLAQVEIVFKVELSNIKVSVNCATFGAPGVQGSQIMFYLPKFFSGALRG